MLFKVVLVVCLQVTFYEVVSSKVLQRPCLFPAEPRVASRGLIENYNPGLNPALPITGRVVGGNLIIDTSNPNSPGVSIFSDNLLIEGAVLVNGNLPFLGTVALEGVVPATGRSAVSYECGAGNIGIVTETPGIILGTGTRL